MYKDRTTAGFQFLIETFFLVYHIRNKMFLEMSVYIQISNPSVLFTNSNFKTIVKLFLWTHGKFIFENLLLLYIYYLFEMGLVFRVLSFQY